MNFRTQYDSHVRFSSRSGDRVKVLYKPQFDDRGNYDLVEAGREDFYGFIQSHKDSTDIHVLLQRFASGDVSALQSRQGMFGDFTQMPKTYAELLNIAISGQAHFDRLPIEVKQRFGNSYSRWLAAMDDMPSFMAAMGFSSQPVDASSASGVEPSVDASPASD